MVYTKTTRIPKTEATPIFSPIYTAKPSIVYFSLGSESSLFASYLFCSYAFWLRSRHFGYIFPTNNIKKCRNEHSSLILWTTVRLIITFVPVIDHETDTNTKLSCKTCETNHDTTASLIRFFHKWHTTTGCIRTYGLHGQRANNVSAELWSSMKSSINYLSHTPKGSPPFGFLYFGYFEPSSAVYIFVHIFHKCRTLG